MKKVRHGNMLPHRKRLSHVTRMNETLCCSVLQCVAVCCSVLQCVEELPTYQESTLWKHVAAQQAPESCHTYE